MRLAPAARPTLYFIGVTTAKSSIMRVFPAWAQLLGLDAAIAGIDFPLHADPADYRAAVEFIRADPHSKGALVTTHKIDLFKACRDLFDVVDPHAALMHETSCLSKADGRLVCHAKDPISSGLAVDGFLPPRHFAETGAELFDVVDPHAALMHETSCLSKADGRLVCHAKDPISSGLAVDGFLPPRHFAETGAELFCMGAGGSTIALTWHLMRPERGADVPSRLVVSDRSRERLDEIRRIHGQVAGGVPVDYVLADESADNDRVLAGLKPGSFVVNATGLGKDRPGSPLSDAARFPDRAIAWDLNYRGDLVFLEQARAQQRARGLQVENGWTYFLHGWTQVIAEVFHIAIPTSGPVFDDIARVAREAA